MYVLVYTVLHQFQSNAFWCSYKSKSNSQKKQTIRVTKALKTKFLL